MNFRRFQKIFFLFVFLLSPALSGAQEGKILLKTKISFAKDGKAQVTYDTRGSQAQDIEVNKIETALVFYALAMFHLNESTPPSMALMAETQNVVSKVATEKGMIRADLLKNSSILKSFRSQATKQNIDLIFAELPNKSHSIEVNPSDLNTKFLAPAVLYLFQDQVKNLSESGLRLMVLSVGGMNKWYREMGKSSDPQSVGQAPAYALNLAVEILEKLSGKKKN